MTIASALEALHSELGDRFSIAKTELTIHGQSETHFPLTLPDGVAYPESPQEVATIIRLCATHACPVIPWGTGTSLEGHSLAIQGGVTVDFSRMDKVLEVNAEDMTVRVQPGCTREALNEELRTTGLFFPVDPGANASLGGMAATRASGTTAVRYGTMRDNVLGAEVVLADGTITRTGTAARKSSAGYDLTALLVGSEGTLGLMTELTLRLYGQPEATAAGVTAFSDMASAVDAVTETIACGIPMARIEFVDSETVRAFNLKDGAQMPQTPHLMVEFHGSDAAVAEQANRFGDIVADHGGTAFKWSEKTEDRNRLWRMRHMAYYAILALQPGARAIVTDVCVPISRLAEAVEVTRADIEASRIEGPILGHVGDGNFHAILLIDPDSTADREEALALSGRMAERALAMGGTVTGEHGVGIGKLDYMEREHGAAWAVMAQIKRALDPQNILNPGKMVRLN